MWQKLTYSGNECNNYLYFSFDADFFDTAEVTKIMGLEPTSLMIKKEPVPKSTSWKYRIDAGNDIDLENNEWIPANPPFLLRNKTTKDMILPIFESYKLCQNGESINYLQTHIAVASAFPEVPPLETIDHIDNGPSNNTITNLM